MNDFCQKNYSFIELLKLTFAYLKSKYKIWGIAISAYLLVLVFVTLGIGKNVYETALKMIADNPETIDFINTVNPSGTQLFVLIHFEIDVLLKVIIRLSLGLVGLALLHNLVAMIIFVSQELYLREAKAAWWQYALYLLRRVPSLLVTDVMLWFYYLMIVVVFLVTIIAGFFLPEMPWIKYLIIPLSLFICIFAVDWCYSYLACYKYKVNGNKAIRYSSLLIKYGFKDTVIWIALSGSVFLGLVLLFANLISVAEVEKLPELLTTTLAVLLSYNFLTKFFTNYLFLNKDYLMREKLDEAAIYSDLITEHLAPLTNEEKLSDDPRKVIRSKAEGAVMRHRHKQAEPQKQQTKEKKPKAKKPKEKETKAKQPKAKK